MSCTVGEIFNNIIYITGSCSAAVAIFCWQLLRFAYFVVSWCLVFLAYVAWTLLGWIASALSTCLYLVGTVAKKACKMPRSSNDILWACIYACIFGAIIGVVARLRMTCARKTNVDVPTKSTTPWKVKLEPDPEPRRRKTHSSSYANLVKDSPSSFNEPLRLSQTWNGNEHYKAAPASSRHAFPGSKTQIPSRRPDPVIEIPPPPPTRPPYQPSQRSKSYSIESFNASEYTSFLESLTDEDLRNESETIVSNLAANAGSMGVHWAHAAATGGLTSPISVVGTLVSARKGYVNDRKLKLVKAALEARTLTTKFGARGVARVVGKGALSVATVGLHPKS